MIDEGGGADQDRTDDLLSAIQALSQTELQPHETADTAGNGTSAVKIPRERREIVARFGHSMKKIT
jgi:hypothetical protein